MINKNKIKLMPDVGLDFTHFHMKDIVRKGTDLNPNSTIILVTFPPVCIIMNLWFVIVVIS